MIAPTGTVAFRKDATPPRVVQRCLSALLLTLALLLGLLAGQFADVGSVADHHSETAIISPTEAPDAVPSCHPALICSAFVIPSGPLTPVVSELGLYQVPDLTRSQLRFDGPPIDLPPPRRLT